jgi:hypothetical protein
MNDKVVYLHRRKSDNKVFYVGMGSEYRPYQLQKQYRSEFWCNYVSKYGEPIVEIVEKNLSKEDAFELEKKLIKKYGRRIKGRGGLVNITKGGDSYGSEANEKRVICLKTGRVFESIKEYCIENNIPHSNISAFLRRVYSKEIDYNVRLIKDNKIIWKPHLDGDENQELVPYTENKGKTIPFKTQSEIDELSVKFNKLPFYDRAIFFISLHKSYRDIFKETGISVSSIHKSIKRTREVMIGKNEPTKRIEYKKCRDKQTNKLIESHGISDVFYFENIIKSYTINVEHREVNSIKLLNEAKKKAIEEKRKALQKQRDEKRRLLREKKEGEQNRIRKLNRLLKKQYKIYPLKNNTTKKPKFTQQVENDVMLNNKTFNQWLMDNNITRIGDTKVYKSKLTKKTYYEIDLIKMYTKRKSVA